MSRLIAVLAMISNLFRSDAILAAQTDMADLKSSSATNQSNSVQIRWTDSDQIDGQLLNWRDGRIQLDSQLFRSPVSIKAELVDAVRFTQRTEPRKGLDAHRLTLINGSIFQGKFLSDEAEKIRFEDYRFGELSIDPSKIAKIETIAKFGYAWDGDLKPWQIQSGQWTIDGEQRLFTSQADSKIWLPFELDESFTIEFEIESQQSLDLVLATGADPEASYRIARIGDSWIAGNRDDFEIIEELSDRQRRLTLKLIHDAATGKLIVRQGDKNVIEVSDKQAMSDHSGVLLQNLGRSLALRTLRIQSGSQQEASVELPSLSATIVEPTPRSLDRLLFKDGSRLWCTVQDLSASTLTINLDQMDVVKSFSVDQVVSITPRSNAEATLIAADKTEHRLQQGQSKLLGTFQLSFDPPTVHWDSDKLAQPAALNTDLPLSIHRQNGMTNDIDGIAGATEVAHFQSGAKIPIQLNRASAAYTWVTTPFAESLVQVNNKFLRSIDLWPKKNKATFTKESREMLLSIPRNLEVDHYGHALIGQNGDLLRGNLVAVNERSIEIDSRQEPLLVERTFVDMLWFLQPSPQDGSSQDSKDSAEKTSTEPSLNEDLRLYMAGGYNIGGSWISGDDDSILIHSPELGECRIGRKSIQSFHFHVPFAATDEAPLLSAWSTKTLAQPRWQAANSEQTNDASRSLIGTMAADLSLPNSNGETIKLSDHLGKVVVLDFWATWCGPCVASLPKYVETTNKFADNQVVFFGINSTETPESVREFLQTRDWPPFDTLFDYDNIASSAMMVNGIPHTVVIGRDGKISHVQVGYSPKGADELYQVIEKLLN